MLGSVSTTSNIESSRWALTQDRMASNLASSLRQSDGYCLVIRYALLDGPNKEFLVNSFPFRIVRAQHKEKVLGLVLDVGIMLLQASNLLPTMCLKDAQVTFEA